MAIKFIKVKTKHVPWIVGIWLSKTALALLFFGNLHLFPF